MERLLILLLCFQIHQVNCKATAFHNGTDITHNIRNEKEIGNLENNNELMVKVDTRSQFGHYLNLPPLNAVILRHSENDISQCANLTLQLSYEAYELYVKSTDYLILIAFQGAKLLVKAIKCFLNNPDERVCIFEAASSAQEIYNYANPLISELLALSGILLDLYNQSVDACI